MVIKEKSPLHLRHELKHSINKADVLELSLRLQKLFPHDEHADSHGFYRVSSIYFETPYDKALRQKIDGVNEREKFRIRHYNGDLSFIRLEKKIKINGLCAKFSAKITAEEVEQLIHGHYDFLLRNEHPLFNELYSKMQGQMLRPRTIVTYEREAFRYKPGNSRITIDRNLRTGFQSIDFLNPDIYHIPVNDNLALLEVKYDAFLPEIVRLAVQTPNRRSAAFSKYAVCRRYD